MSLFSAISASLFPTGTWDIDAHSITGPVRQDNEDFVLSARSGKGAIALLADGVGGHNAGEVASRFVCEELVAWFNSRDKPASLEAAKTALGDAIHTVHDRLFRLSREQENQSGMATTLALVMQYGRHGIYAWAGDSRIYLWRLGVLTQLSRDHSFVEEKFRQGIFTREDAEQHPMGNIITSCLGARETIESLGLASLVLKKHDQLLLVSDGVSDVVAPEQLTVLVPQGVEAILLAAQEAYSNDNCSAVIVSVN